MLVNLRCGDCLEEMAHIPNGSVDCILTDLPYGVTACKWDCVIPFEPLWTHYKRIIKPDGAIVLFGSQPFTSALVMSNPKWFRYEWVWDKKHPKGHLNARIMPLRRHESVLVFAAGKAPYYPQMRTGKYRKKGGGSAQSNKGCYGYHQRPEVYNDQYYPTSILDITNAHQAAKVHPTQKPVALLQYLIKTYTHEGETVLDSCMGSGSTGVACVQTLRRFIGIERDPSYFETAQTRIQAALSPLQNHTDPTTTEDMYEPLRRAA